MKAKDYLMMSPVQLGEDADGEPVYLQDDEYAFAEICNIMDEYHNVRLNEGLSQSDIRTRAQGYALTRGDSLDVRQAFFDGANYVINNLKATSYDDMAGR